MQLRDRQTTLLSMANDAVVELLGQDLQNARVAIFTSQASDPPETFAAAATVQKNWRPLSPQPAPQPLVDRVAAAVQLLQQQPQPQKWLILLSDLQQREFGRPLGDMGKIHTVIIDLHPEQAASAAVVGVQCDPAQPRLGIGAQIAVRVSGPPGQQRAVNLSVASLDSPEAAARPPALPMAQLDAGGRALLRVPLVFSSPGWTLLTASLATPEDLAWAARRGELVRTAAPTATAVLQVPRPNAQADAIVRLALDPSQGADSAWPISVRPAGPLRGDERLIVANITQWLDSAAAQQLADFANRGGTLVLFIQPGLEQSWQQLPQDQKNIWLQILPGQLLWPAASGPFHGIIMRPDDPLLSNVGPTPSASGKLRIGRMVGFDVTDGSVQTILAAAADEANPSSKLRGLLMRRPIGAGQAYIWSTLPTPLYGNLATYELFLPMLVNSSLPAAGQMQALNVELGQRLALAASESPGDAAVDLAGPHGPAYRVKLSDDGGGRRFVSEPTSETGVYAWKRGQQTIAYSNAEYPAAEADLRYRLAAEIAPAGPNVMVARSVPQLQTQLQEAGGPQPRWPLPLAIVLLLLCLEALVSNWQRWRQAASPRPSAPVISAIT